MMPQLEPPVTSPVRAQLWFCLDDDANRAVAAGQAWFELALQTVGHEVRDQLAAAVANGAYVGDADERRVEGGIGTLLLVKGLTGGGRSRWSGAYTPNGWRKLLDDLGRLPTRAVFDANTWVRDPQTPAHMLWSGPPKIKIDWVRPDEAPNWVLLEVTGTEALLVGDPDRDVAMIGLVREVADRYPPVGAEVGYEYDQYRTALEDALGRDVSTSFLRDLGRPPQPQVLQRGTPHAVRLGGEVTTLGPQQVEDVPSLRRSTRDVQVRLGTLGKAAPGGGHLAWLERQSTSS